MADYLVFLECLGRVLEGAPTEVLVVLLGDFNTHVGNGSDTWRGVIVKNSVHNLNLSGFQLDLCP